MNRCMRIAILAHSTNPRGGVVHALELGDALCRLGHDASVHAPDAGGRGFFRNSLARTVCVAASPVGRGVAAVVETRIADYLRHFERAEHRCFDVWHAQDGISANALATLKERRRISGFARTVHHVDDFADPRLAALQSRAIESADFNRMRSLVGWVERSETHRPACHWKALMAFASAQPISCGSASRSTCSGAPTCGKRCTRRASANESRARSLRDAA